MEGERWGRRGKVGHFQGNAVEAGSVGQGEIVVEREGADVRRQLRRRWISRSTQLSRFSIAT